MSTTKTWLQAISGIKTGKQNSIAISRKDCVSLPCPWSNWSSKSRIADNHTLNEFCRYSYGCAVLPSTCKDYGKENHGLSYLCKPYGRNTPAAAFR
ncbi:unnamed protein product, partial [Brassica oleracea var. botrytis]